MEVIHSQFSNESERNSPYVNCMAHKLNLVLVESCTVNRDIKACLNVTDKLYCIFAEPSNHCKFLMMQVKRFCEDFSGVCAESSPQAGGK